MLNINKGKLHQLVTKDEYYLLLSKVKETKEKRCAKTLEEN